MDIAPGLRRDMTPGETLWLQTPSVAVGAFRAAPADPWFRGSGPLQLHYLAFPLGRAVEICHVDRAPFVATPATLSLLAPGDRYTRRALAPEGDRVLYIALSPDAMAQAAAGTTPAQLERAPALSGLSGARPLAPGTAMGVRLLAADLARRCVATTLEAEERVALLVRAALGAVPVVTGTPRQPASAAAQRRKVERAQAYMAMHCDAPLSLDALGRVAATTPCHLARLFRRHAGCAVHTYLTRLRLARALDLLLEQPGALSEVALRLGFTHHSHFGSCFRAAFGLTPSAYQGRALSAAARRRRQRAHLARAAD